MGLADIAVRVASRTFRVGEEKPAPTAAAVGHKYIVVYVDGGHLTVGGWADSLPFDDEKGYVGPGIYSQGDLADGAPHYLEMPSYQYVPEPEEPSQSE